MASVLGTSRPSGASQSVTKASSSKGVSMRRSFAVIAMLLAVVLSACGGEEADPLPTPTVVPLPQPSDSAFATPLDAMPTPSSTQGPTTATSDAAETPSPTPTPTPSVNATSSTPSTAETATGTRQLDYFLKRQAGDRVWVEPVSFDYDPDVVGGGVAREALTRLLAAPDQGELTNLVPEGTSLRGIEVTEGVLRIDLSSEAATNPGAGAEAELAFQQMLAHTGAQFPTVDRVQVVVAGEPVDSLWGHVDWSQPFEPDPFLLSPIIIEHADGSAGTIRLSGTANVFEATVELLLTDDTGGVVEETFATASCGTGCRGDFDASFDGLQPGRYTITAREPDPSDGEGFAPFEVAVPVDVS